VGGHSKFLFEGKASQAECAAKCVGPLADRCHFITVNDGYCQATSHPIDAGPLRVLRIV